MKKLALIMLAVVSMALVSCGGGKGSDGSDGKKGDEKAVNVGVKPADPAITYAAATKDNQVDLRNCLQVKSVAIRENGYDFESGSSKISITAKVEMINEPSEPISGIEFAKLNILDENEARICGDTRETLQGVIHKGDVGTVSGVAWTQLPSDQVIKDARFVMLEGAMGWK